MSKRIIVKEEKEDKVCSCCKKTVTVMARHSLSGHTPPRKNIQYFHGRTKLTSLPFRCIDCLKLYLGAKTYKIYKESKRPCMNCGVMTINRYRCTECWTNNKECVGMINSGAIYF